MSTARLSGKQKAAALLMAIGPEVAAKVTRYLEPQEVESLTFEMLNLERLPPAVRDAAFRECFQEVIAKTGRVGALPSAVPPKQELAFGVSYTPSSVQKGSARKEGPFAFLADVEPGQLAVFLQEEHPQTTALVLAYAEPHLAGAVLERLPSELQAEVATRIAALDRASPEVLAEVQEALKRRLSFAADGNPARAGGVDCLARILGQSSRATEKSILATLEAIVPELAENVKKQLFVFENITQLDDRSIQRVLREIDNKDLALALKGTSEAILSRVLKNMSSRAGEALAEDIAALGPVRGRTVEEARARIVAAIRRLDEAEEIVIARGGEGDVLV